jgi:hypothetical protein
MGPVTLTATIVNAFMMQETVNVHLLAHHKNLATRFVTLNAIVLFAIMTTLNAKNALLGVNGLILIMENVKWPALFQSADSMGLIALAVKIVRFLVWSIGNVKKLVIKVNVFMTIRLALNVQLDVQF